MRFLVHLKLLKKPLALLVVVLTGFVSVSGGVRAYAANQRLAENEILEKFEEKSFIVHNEKGRRLKQKRQKIIQIFLPLRTIQPPSLNRFESQPVNPSQWATPPPLLRAPPALV